MVHNYKVKLERLIAEGKIPIEHGKLGHLHTAHDDWCGIFSGRECNCDPDISYETDESYRKRTGL